MSDNFLKPVLAIDTSLSGCVIGLFNPLNNDFFEDVLKTERAQSAVIVPMVQKLLNKAGLAFNDIGLVVTTNGPGSFTGLRIGMTTAITLGLSLNIPVQGVGTIECMIGSCAKDHNCENGYACVLETKRNDFYFGMLNKNFNKTDDFFSGNFDVIIERCSNKNFILCGDATHRFLSMGHNVEGHFKSVIQKDLVDAKVLCEGGLAAFLKNGQKTTRPEPLYLRPADVSKSSKLQREINNSSF